MRAWLLAAACLKHCLNCLFVHFGCHQAVIFRNISWLLCCGAVWSPSKACFQPNCGESAWADFQHWFLCSNDKQFLSYICILKAAGKKKPKQNEKPWLKARLLRLMEHETDRIPLGVTIWKQTCTHISIPELYRPSFLYILLSISLSSR